MKKLALVGLLLLLALQIVPAAATPLDELTELAAYFPDDTQIFVAARIDDDYFATLDSLIERLAEAASAQATAAPSIRAELERTAQAMTQGESDFETLFRSWMGDTAVVAVENTASLLLGSELRAVVGVSVTDRDGAEAFFDEMIGLWGRYEKSDRYGGLLYEAQDDFNASYLLLDDVVLAAPAGQSARTLNLRVRESLAESEPFTEALATLPADEYNIVVYANLPEIIAPLAAFAPMALGESMPQDFDLTPVIEGLGAMTLGFTIVEEQSLVMDVSLVVNDPAIFRDAGLPLGQLPALDLDFAAYLPANAALVIQDQGFGSDLIDLVDALDALSEQLEAAGVYPLMQNTSGFSMSEAERELLESFNLNDVATFVRQAFRGMTGLTLEEGLGWMTADYALYVALVPLEVGGLTFDIGVMNAVTDSNAAGALFEGLQSAFEQGGVIYTVEDGALVLPFLSDALADAYFVESVPEGELLAVLTNDVLALGTRPGVEHVLNPQDGGLAGTDAYTAARDAFLPGAHMLWYISMEGFTTPIRALTSASPDAEQAFALAEVINSLSMTAVSDEDGTGVVRFAITLAE